MVTAKEYLRSAQQELTSPTSRRIIRVVLTRVLNERGLDQDGHVERDIVVSCRGRLEKIYPTKKNMDEGFREALDAAAAFIDGSLGRANIVGAETAKRYLDSYADSAPADESPIPEGLKYRNGSLVKVSDVKGEWGTLHSFEEGMYIVRCEGDVIKKIAPEQMDEWNEETDPAMTMTTIPAPIAANA